jgi:hypothetical protein
MRDPQEVNDWLKKAENDLEGAISLSRKRKNTIAGFSLFSLPASR